MLWPCRARGREKKTLLNFFAAANVSREREREKEARHRAPLLSRTEAAFDKA